ncbi:MAG TPA: hypothetical protein VL593_08250 [Ramlibacter sp.]|jgi:hypothetical protein|nr:hypothetical protein [Ramlibacter sp.]
MPIVYIYPGHGTFAGSQFEWNCPPLASKHELMLFVRQDEDKPAAHVALDALERYGFKHVKLTQQGKPIDIEALNDPKLADFRRNYEESMAKGFSLVWYP